MRGRNPAPGASRSVAVVNADPVGSTIDQTGEPNSGYAPYPRSTSPCSPQRADRSPSLRLASGAAPTWHQRAPFRSLDRLDVATG